MIAVRMFKSAAKAADLKAALIRQGIAACTKASDRYTAVMVPRDKEQAAYKVADSNAATLAATIGYPAHHHHPELAAEL
jgi:hypothetical protein